MSGGGRPPLPIEVRLERLRVRGESERGSAERSDARKLCEKAGVEIPAWASKKRERRINSDRPAEAAAPYRRSNNEAEALNEIAAMKLRIEQEAEARWTLAAMRDRAMRDRRIGNRPANS